MPTLEEAERQQKQVPEEAHFPLQCQAGAGDHDGPRAHEIDQRAKGEHQPETEHDQRQQVAVVRDDDIIEHELEADRDGKTDGLQDQRHRQHLGRHRGEPIGAAQQVPDPNPRAFRLSLETLGRPGFEHDASKALIDFLHRHVSTAHALDHG